MKPWKYGRWLLKIFLTTTPSKSKLIKIPILRALKFSFATEEWQIENVWNGTASAPQTTNTTTSSSACNCRWQTPTSSTGTSSSKSSSTWKCNRTPQVKPSQSSRGTSKFTTRSSIPRCSNSLKFSISMFRKTISHVWLNRAHWVSNTCVCRNSRAFTNLFWIVTRPSSRKISLWCAIKKQVPNGTWGSTCRWCSEQSKNACLSTKSNCAKSSCKSSNVWWKAKPLNLLSFASTSLSLKWTIQLIEWCCHLICLASRKASKPMQVLTINNVASVMLKVKTCWWKCKDRCATKSPNRNTDRMKSKGMKRCSWECSRIRLPKTMSISKCSRTV